MLFHERVLPCTYITLLTGCHTCITVPLCADGGVYELGLADWAKLCASEGVPFGYRVIEVQVELYSGNRVPAWTLEAGSPSVLGDLPPSERYLSLLRDGAQELGLTRAWQERLASVAVAPLGTRAPLQAEQYERRRGATFI